jgi:hypothetical protein
MSGISLFQETFAFGGINLSPFIETRVVDSDRGGNGQGLG